MALVGTREINKVEVEIHADKYGNWAIHLPAEEGEKSVSIGVGPTLDTAINNARIQIKKNQTKVSVEFKTMNGQTGIAHSRHARSRNKVLARVNGKPEQIDYHTQTLKPDTPQSVIDHYNELGEEAARMKNEQRELFKKWSLDLGSAVDKAIKEATENA